MRRYHGTLQDLILYDDQGQERGNELQSVNREALVRLL